MQTLGLQNQETPTLMLVIIKKGRFWEDVLDFTIYFLLKKHIGVCLLNLGLNTKGNLLFYMFLIKTKETKN